MQFCNDGLAGSNVPFKLTFITASPLPAILKITVPRRLDTSTFLRGVPTVPAGVGPGAVKRGYRVVCVEVYEFYTLSLILKKSGSHQEKKKYCKHLRPFRTVKIKINNNNNKKLRNKQFEFFLTWKLHCFSKQYKSLIYLIYLLPG